MTRNVERGCAHEPGVSGGRGDRIRTCDILLPKQALYRAELHPESACPAANAGLYDNFTPWVGATRFTLQNRARVSIAARFHLPLDERLMRLRLLPEAALITRHSGRPTIS